MGREDVEVVRRMQALVAEGDLKAAIGRQDFSAAMRELIHPGADIRFADAEGGVLGDFHDTGTEALRSGWADWLQAWEEFRIHFEGDEDLGDGRVLSLVLLQGQMRGGVDLLQRGAYISRVRDGVVVAMHFYLDRDQARREAGLS